MDELRRGSGEVRGLFGFVVLHDYGDKRMLEAIRSL